MREGGNSTGFNFLMEASRINWIWNPDLASEVERRASQRLGGVRAERGGLAWPAELRFYGIGTVFFFK